MLGNFSIRYISLQRVTRNRVRTKGLTKSANVDHRAEVEVVFAKAGKIESLTTPLNLFKNEIKPPVMIDKTAQPVPTIDEKMFS